MARTVFITGVRSGIGLGLAQACLERGDRVYGLSRRPPERLEAYRRKPDPDFIFAPVDLSDLDGIAPKVGSLLHGIESLDLVILNAGVLGEIGDMTDTPLARLRQVMDVNLWANKPVLDAVFAGGRAVAQVVGISSGAAVSGARGWNAYAISKAALNMMMRLYAAEFPGTHFSALAPGLVDTAMQEQMRGLPADPRFPTVDRLKKAAGTADMPDAEMVAPRLLAAMDRVRELKSGDFHDLRTLH
jgi:NAD(P)-dependent dehydrogenase (short-subunit alcohol dehydrogenase family)